MEQRARVQGVVERVSGAVTRWTGSTNAFACAVVVIVVWATLGPLFRYSDTWQLVINTGTTIVTFLMVFGRALLQSRQPRRHLFGLFDDPFGAWEREIVDDVDEQQRRASHRQNNRSGSVRRSLVGAATAASHHNVSSAR